MNFFRLLARVRYWKRRALNAETRCLDLIERFAADKAALEAQANAEMWRNRMREDTLTSARGLGAKGMYGLAPRVGPASTQKPQSILQSAAPTMTAIDKMEFETEWLPYAVQNGFTRQQAEKDFLAELINRKALNDEPTM
jgi:hypothetical protein